MELRTQYQATDPFAEFSMLSISHLVGA